MKQVNDKPPQQQQQQDVLFARERLNIESLQLVWLDNDENLKSIIINILHELLNTYGHYYYFRSVDECSEFIKENNIPTLLVSPVRLTELILSQVHNINYIQSVYIYSFSQNEEDNAQKLKKEFTKVSLS
jgi:hypothetical protein